MMYRLLHIMFHLFRAFKSLCWCLVYFVRDYVLRKRPKSWWDEDE